MKGSPEVQERIRQIAEAIWREYKPETIILFGSYAYGEPTEDSDVDLLIVKETEEAPAERWMTVCKILREPARKMAIMPLVYRPAELSRRLDIGDLFLREVLRRGEVLRG